MTEPAAPAGSAAPVAPIALAGRLYEAGQYEEAARICGAVLTANRRDARASLLMGSIALRRGEPGIALRFAEVTLAIAPSRAAAHYLRGTALEALDRPAEALESFSRAAALDPALTAAHSRRGHHLAEQGDRLAAIEAYDRALALTPGDAHAWEARGALLYDLRHLEAALASFERAASLGSHPAENHAARGAILHELGRLDEALAAFAESRTANPDYALATWYQSLAFLAMGDYRAGWAGYEYRFVAGAVPLPAWHGLPRWDGTQDIAGRAILLHGEQGLGDMLQFCRYVPLVAARGARVALVVAPALRRLMETLPGGITILTDGDAIPPFDFHCSLMSLPHAFGTELATVPANIPYLAANPAAARAWRDRLVRLENGAPALLVGLVWAGQARPDIKAALAIDGRRSLPLASLAPLAGIAGVRFVSLQKTPPAEAPRDPPPGLIIHDFTRELEDFADTAALIAALDLVIAVDTSVAHLAGALGKPVWLLNRFDTCWRWPRDRDDSPWYPTLRQFRQTAPGDWDGVIARLRAALEDAAALHQAGALFDAGRLDEAMAACGRLLETDRQDARAIALMGRILLHRGDPPLALRYLDAALARDPASGLAWFERGNALGLLNRPEEALESFGRAEARGFDEPRLHASRGVALQDIGRIEAARAAYAAARQRDPAAPRFAWLEGIAQLALGDYAQGFANHERRFDIPDIPRVDWVRSKPRWTGVEAIAGRRLLLYAEGGFGDTLHFCRYVPMVAARGAVVLLHVQPELAPLLAGLPGVSAMIAEGAPASFDLHASLISLPAVFGTGLETIPADIPYLRADPAKREAWQARLAALPGRRIGLAWGGDPGQDWGKAVLDRRRSLPLARLAPLAGIAGVTFISLQKGPPSEALRAPPPGLIIHDFTDELDDFADTAALIEALDLVIAVDTSVAHLAGALGKPIWLLNRFDSCWRWLRDRDDSPWYPTLRQFRQTTPGDWDGVIARVQAALEQY